ncbi:hypothetical protein CGLO_04423 [Colletotrichum gloeosporioides Cg-14]|uniref:Uncharacterized protein n=1 Tax=Colletotrichum gloeosporioides (strain Cg-14) TaxID=1237896 RepID=T0KU63_COLGC|nr:hypothetical protein CGLO_04423 [Colletotrichum gloeosporioides Cg-14]
MMNNLQKGEADPVVVHRALKAYEAAFNADKQKILDGFRQQRIEIRESHDAIDRVLNKLQRLHHRVYYWDDRIDDWMAKMDATPVPERFDFRRVLQAGLWMLSGGTAVYTAHLPYARATTFPIAILYFTVLVGASIVAIAVVVVVVVVAVIVVFTIVVVVTNTAVVIKIVIVPIIIIIVTIVVVITVVVVVVVIAIAIAIDTIVFDDGN